MTGSLFDVIYIEKAVENHPRVLKLLNKYSDKIHITIERYGEVFNRRAQNFRLQKEKPALILAQKQKGFLNPIPQNYGIGSKHNYYFSHMLNCPFDCRYCFLQGLYLSAHFVLFVNFEDFQNHIKQKIEEAPEASFTFFSGYDADSLALDSLSNFTTDFVPFFQQFPNAELEIRTKSLNIQNLIRLDPTENIVVSYTLSPDNVIKHLETKTPSLDKRLDRLVKLQRKGYKVGLRFDPVIYHSNFKENYQALFDKTFESLDHSLIHSVTLGTFRLPRGIFKQMKKNAPQDQLLATCTDSGSSMVSYSEDIQNELMDFCKNHLLKHTSKEKLFSCL